MPTPPPLLCHHCRYDLTGLADVTIDRGEVTCPECGARVEHFRGRSLLDTRWIAGWRDLSGPVHGVLAPLILGVLLPIVVIAVGIALDGGPRGINLIPAFILCAGFLFFFFSIWVRLIRTPRPPGYPAGRWRVLIAAIIALTLGMPLVPTLLVGLLLWAAIALPGQ